VFPVTHKSHNVVTFTVQCCQNDLGGACSTCGGEERLILGLGGRGDLRERDHLGDPGVDGGG